MSVELACAEVSSLLNQFREATIVPNGARKAVAMAVDGLRYSGVAEDHATVAGELSAAIHQLELALCLGDLSKQSAARERLGQIGERWSALEAPFSATC